MSITKHCGTSAKWLYLNYPNGLTPFHSKRELLWRFKVVGNNKTYLSHVKCLTFLSDFNKIWIFSTRFHYVPNNKHDGNPCSESRTDTCGRTDTTKVKVAFRGYENVPKKHTIEELILVCAKNNPNVLTGSNSSRTTHKKKSRCHDILSQVPDKIRQLQVVCSAHNHFSFALGTLKIDDVTQYLSKLQRLQEPFWKWVISSWRTAPNAKTCAKFATTRSLRVRMSLCVPSLHSNLAGSLAYPSVRKNSLSWFRL